ncbi:hypothetical protein HPB52_022298 [Rhipicephalus sanguineus]|uniref:HTH psq-type domain-containing protein n=1 Tax=Rhipicephalus sanguineus TaxID=34632 RepID=A0A9D4T0B0_RHISA|nr:hypothetical protein HPB52_022298 [Rhipicephalus sanguineus]
MSSPGPSVKKKRCQFSLKEKVDILMDLNAGKKQVDICRERDIAPSTVAMILKDWEKIVKLHQESQLAQENACGWATTKSSTPPSSHGVKMPDNTLDPELWNELPEKLLVDAAVTIEDYVDSDCAVATSAELTCEEIVNVSDEPLLGEPAVPDSFATSDEVAASWMALRDAGVVPDSESFCDYVSADFEVVATEQLPDDNIVRSVNNPDETRDNDSVDERETNVPTASETLDAMDVLRCYFDAHESGEDGLNIAAAADSDVVVFLEKTRSYLGCCKDVSDDILRKVADVEEYTHQRLLSTHRKKITDFFKQ